MRHIYKIFYCAVIAEILSFKACQNIQDSQKYAKISQNIHFGEHKSLNNKKKRQKFF